jgi:hypothetical protein
MPTANIVVAAVAVDPYSLSAFPTGFLNSITTITTAHGQYNRYKKSGFAITPPN